MHSINCGDGVVQRKSPSMSLLQGSSNFSIHNSNFNQIHGNATIIRFGSDKFTQEQRNWICDYISTHVALPGISDNLNRCFLTQLIINLPRAEAVFNDYRNKKKSGPCFEGTRVSILREMADWVTDMDGSRMYILSGLAGIGKSTIAYTIASRAAVLNLLGASFFFSRDETDRNNANKLFTTIAYQLCVFDEMFAKVIGDALQTDHGSAATTKDPQEQLQVLILTPLRTIIQSRTRPVLVIVDALDECDEDDEYTVIMGLSQLVRDLPPFKVILTTRPKPSLNYFQDGLDGHKLFHLQDIEDIVTFGFTSNTVYPQNKSASVSSGTNGSHTIQGPWSLLLFYTVILRNVVPLDCDDDGIVGRYQSVVGAIISVQRPLPVSTLSHLMHIDEEEIRVVLDHLQSVILLGNDDVPRIYHKSFPDYLMDPARCKDARLQIDPKAHHTQIVSCCFEITNKHLKYNILRLGKTARYMSNKDGLEEDGITDEQFQERIPQQLRYACVYWANHLQVATIENAGLMNGLLRFVDEHTLHWIEVMSLIGNLDLVHRALHLVLKNLDSTSSDLQQLLSDALRFILRFYKIIQRSALHTYYSALAFSPTGSLLYQRFIKEAEHQIFVIEGGPKKWDALVASPSHGPYVDFIKFSSDSALFFSCSEDEYGMMKIWDAVTGTPVSTIQGERFAVNNDFSTVASSNADIITYYNTNGSKRGTIFTTSSKVESLALSDSSKIAAALADGTVLLWGIEDAESIHIFDEFRGSKDRVWLLKFSSTGTRLVYSMASDSVLKLRDGMDGRFIADLQCGSEHDFVFSADGTRMASLSFERGLILWSSESGAFIGAVKINVIGVKFSISANGSLLATTLRKCHLGDVMLWNESHEHLAPIEVVESRSTESLAFSPDNILAIGCANNIRLYDVKTHSFISTLPFHGFSVILAFSPNCTRLVCGGYDQMYLWDIQGIDTSSSPPYKASAVIAIVLSRDCSRLACGYEDGRVELWRTSPAIQRIASHHVHKASTIGFEPAGRLFASGSNDGTVNLWNSRDGSLHGTLQAPNEPTVVALSNSMLVAAGKGDVTLWSLDTLSLIHAFPKSNKYFLSTVSISDESDLVAVGCDFQLVDLIDVENRTIIATFNVPGKVPKLTFLPDKSHLMAQPLSGNILSFNLIDKSITERPMFEHLIQLPNTPLWHGVPIWHCDAEGAHYFSALFSPHKKPVPVLWIPSDLPVMRWTEGLSMIALGCSDGRVILLRLPTSHVG